PLDDLIFQCRDAEGPLAAIRLRDVHPLDRTRVVPPSLEAVRQVPQICLQVLSIGRPGLSINARSRIAVQPVIRLAESVDIVDMVPERSQRLRVVPPRCLSYPVERTLQGLPGPAHSVSVHARGLRPRQVGPSLAISGWSVLPSAC